MKKVISSLVMLVLSLFVLITEIFTEPTLAVVVSSGLLVLASIIWLVLDLEELKKHKKEEK